MNETKLLMVLCKMRNDENFRDSRLKILDSRNEYVILSVRRVHVTFLLFYFSLWTSVYLFMGEHLLILKNNIIHFFKNESWVTLQNYDLRNGKKHCHFPCLLIGKLFFLKCQAQKMQLTKHEQFDLKNIFRI